MPTLELGAKKFEATVADHEIVLVGLWASCCGPAAPSVRRRSGSTRSSPRRFPCNVLVRSLDETNTWSRCLTRTR